MRLKTKIYDLEDASEKLGTLDTFAYVPSARGIELGYDKDEVKLGVSAQQVHAVIPDAIIDAPVNIEHGTDYMNVDYAKGLVPYLIAAHNEHSAEIRELRAELEELRRRSV